MKLDQDNRAMDDRVGGLEEDFVNDGSTDYKGRIAERERTGGYGTAPFIFGPEITEKMAVTGLTVNFVPYLTTQMHLPSSYAANLVTTYQGTAYLFTLIGGFVADALVGRFWTLAGAVAIQLVGLVTILLSATLPVFKPPFCENTVGMKCPAQKGWDLNIIYIGVYLIALGTGGIKSCGSSFGADQFEADHPKEKKKLGGFFSWYFFCVTFGGLFAVTVLVYIQDNVGRAVGYAIPTAIMACVLVAFVLGRPWYRFKAPKGSPITQIAQVFTAAYRKRRLPHPADAGLLYELSEKEQPKGYFKVEHSTQFAFLDKAAILESNTISLPASPWQLATVTKVEEVKMVLRLVPILLTTSLFYTVFAQMTTFSTSQSRSMNRKITSGFTLPAASMATFLQVSILLTLFVWQKAIVPVIRRLTGHEQGCTSLQKIGVGLVISVISMVIAASTEYGRMKEVKAEHLELNPTASIKTSVFWLLPQYFLVGAGEALTYSGQLDFFYNQSPKGMRSMGAALCVCTLSMGYYCSSLLVSLVNQCTGHYVDGEVVGEWLPENINQGRLDKFYMTLAVISFINFIMYLGCAHWYRFKLAIKEDYSTPDEIDKESEYDNEPRANMTKIRSKKSSYLKLDYNHWPHKSPKGEIRREDSMSEYGSKGRSFDYP